jgi:hypothetical protein
MEERQRISQEKTTKLGMETISICKLGEIQKQIFPRSLKINFHPPFNQQEVNIVTIISSLIKLLAHTYGQTYNTL